MRSNFLTFGESKKGNLILLASVLIIALFLALPVTGRFGLVLLILTVALARKLQDQDIKTYITEGGNIASGWRVLGVCCVTWVFLFGGIVALSFAIPSDMKNLQYSDKETIVYNSSVAEDEAKAFGDYLAAKGIFNGQKRQGALLLAEAENTLIYVDGKKLDDSGVIAQYQQLLDELHEKHVLKQPYKSIKMSLNDYKGKIEPVTLQLSDL